MDGRLVAADAASALLLLGAAAPLGEEVEAAETAKVALVIMG
jgi:hypothetical protein